MAYNPSKRVAVARLAAQKLKAPIAIVITVKEGKADMLQVKTTSYGSNKALCDFAKILGDKAHRAITTVSSEK